MPVGYSGLAQLSSSAKSSEVLEGFATYHKADFQTLYLQTSVCSRVF